MRGFGECWMARRFRSRSIRACLLEAVAADADLPRRTFYRATSAVSVDRGYQSVVRNGPQGSVSGVWPISTFSRWRHWINRRDLLLARVRRVIRDRSAEIKAVRDGNGNCDDQSGTQDCANHTGFPSAHGNLLQKPSAHRVPVIMTLVRAMGE